MADYNIYIHSLGEQGGGQQDFTMPWKQSQSSPTKAWQKQDDDTSFKDVMTTAPYAVKNIKQTAVSGGAAGVVLAIGAAIVKGAIEVHKLAMSFRVPATGDYREQVAWNNFEAAKSAIFHPITTTINFHHTMQQTRLQNERNNITRTLLGDSEINTYLDRGY